MLQISDAPTAARKLVKACPYLRQHISKLSKSEQAGVQGSTEERERVSANFEKDVRAANHNIADTRKIATAFGNAAQILQSGDRQTNKTDPLSASATRVVRLGLSPAQCASLAAKLNQAAVQGCDAAERAQDRLDENHDDLSSVGGLCELSAKLPGVKFSITHPAVAGIRQKYLAFGRAAKQRKT